MATPAPARAPDAPRARAAERAIAARDRAQRRNLVLFFALAGGALVLAFVAPRLPLGGFLLTFVALLVSSTIGVLPHELAHAGVAQLVGGRVAAVEIGHGRPLARFELRGVDVLLRMIPLSGCVHLDWRRERKPSPLAATLVFAAGPLAEVAVGTVLVVVLLPGGAPLAPRYDARFLAAALTFGMFFDAATNLVPGFVERTTRLSANDGRRILETLLGDRPLPFHLYAPRVPWLHRLPVAVLEALATCARASAILACATLFAQLAWTAAGARAWYPWPVLGAAVCVLAVVASTLVLAAEDARASSGRGRPGAGDAPAMRFVCELMDSERRDAELLALREGDRIVAALRARRLQDAEQELDRLAAAAPGSVYAALLRIGLLVTSGREAEAERLLAAIQGARPSPEVAMQAHSEFFAALLEVPGASARAARAIRAWVDATDDPDLICTLLDQIASRVLQQRLEPLFAEVAACTALGVARAPDHMPLTATHAALLVEIGDVAAARPLLERVVAEAATEPDVGLALWFLALCTARDGDTRSAARLARRARLLLPDRQVGERVWREIAAS